MTTRQMIQKLDPGERFLIFAILCSLFAGIVLNIPGIAISIILIKSLGLF